MKKTFGMLFIFLITFSLGFATSKYFATHRTSSKPMNVVKVWPTDQLIYANSTGLVKLTAQGESVLVTAPQLSSPVVISSPSAGVIAISRGQNFSSLLSFDQQGNLNKTLLAGDQQNFDKMIWVADPSISPDQKTLAFVSDKDRYTTGQVDNGIYLLDRSSGKMSQLSQPTFLTGGFANPMFNPQDANQLLVTNYQYNHTTFAPYSMLQLFDLKKQTSVDLTTELQNAYQPSFSSDGKQLLFLSRDTESNQVKLMLAAVENQQLSNVQTLATGQFAYPRFSNSEGKIYYLTAEKNSEFHLETAIISNQSLINRQQITTSAPLSATSAYWVAGVL